MQHSLHGKLLHSQKSGVPSRCVECEMKTQRAWVSQIVWKAQAARKRFSHSRPVPLL